jgi:hypothetical protein
MKYFWRDQWEEDGFDAFETWYIMRGVETDPYLFSNEFIAQCNSEQCAQLVCDALNAFATK